MDTGAPFCIGRRNVTSILSMEGTEVRRLQFPIAPATLQTINKCQGSTRQLGWRTFLEVAPAPNGAALYVGASRNVSGEDVWFTGVESFEGMHLEVDVAQQANRQAVTQAVLDAVGFPITIPVPAIAVALDSDLQRERHARLWPYMAIDLDSATEQRLRFALRNGLAFEDEWVCEFPEAIPPWAARWNYEENGVAWERIRIWEALVDRRRHVRQPPAPRQPEAVALDPMAEDEPADPDDVCLDGEADQEEEPPLLGPVVDFPELEPPSEPDALEWEGPLPSWVQSDAQHAEFEQRHARARDQLGLLQAGLTAVQDVPLDFWSLDPREIIPGSYLAEQEAQVRLRRDIVVRCSPHFRRVASGLLAAIRPLLCVREVIDALQAESSSSLRDLLLVPSRGDGFLNRYWAAALAQTPELSAIRLPDDSFDPGEVLDVIIGAFASLRALFSSPGSVLYPRHCVLDGQMHELPPIQRERFAFVGPTWEEYDADNWAFPPLATSRSCLILDTRTLALGRDIAHMPTWVQGVDDSWWKFYAFVREVCDEVELTSLWMHYEVTCDSPRQWIAFDGDRPVEVDSSDWVPQFAFYQRRAGPLAEPVMITPPAPPRPIARGTAAGGSAVSGSNDDVVFAGGPPTRRPLPRFEDDWMPIRSPLRPRAKAVFSRPPVPVVARPDDPLVAAMAHLFPAGVSPEEHAAAARRHLSAIYQPMLGIGPGYASE
jgi:hypothetical protein